MVACANFRFFFFNATATTEIYTLSLHDALPISLASGLADPTDGTRQLSVRCAQNKRDRKSTRLNSSHITISYAVFCLKKKNVKALITRNRLASGNPGCLPQ